MKNYSSEDIGVLVGTLCGDGSYSRNTLSCGQSIKQKDWFYFKKNRFEKIFNQRFKTRIYKCRYNTSILMFNTKTSDLSKYLINLFYNSGKKVISQEVLNLLTPEGIAWWYMDDGSMSIKKINGKVRGAEITLNTYISARDNQIIIDYFKNQFNITWKLNKTKGSYRLRMGKKEAKNKFFPLIEKYIIPSMRYKIDFNKI